METLPTEMSRNAGEDIDTDDNEKSHGTKGRKILIQRRRERYSSHNARLGKKIARKWI